MANMSKAITALNGNIDDLSVEITSSWNSMMRGASIRGVLRLRLQIFRLLDAIGDSGEVKKHRKKLVRYISELKTIEEIDLNSKTYIKQVLTPLKVLTADFTSWIKDGSLKNIISEDQIKYITGKAIRTADAKVVAFEEKVEEAKAEEAKAA